MKHEGCVWNGGVDFLQAVEVEFDFSFVESVRSSDRHGKRVNVCLIHEPCSVCCFGQKSCRCCCGIIVLAHVAQLSFNRHTGGMRELDHAPRQRTVIGKRHFGAVDHHGGISVFNAARC